MSNLPRQSASSAFRTEAYASGAMALPNRRTVVPTPSAPERPRPTPSPRPRKTVQTGWLFGLVIFATLIVSAGLVYLSGHAQVTAEGYRRTKLMSLLRQEREKQKQAQQMKALLYTQQHIEHKARAMGMVPADEKQVVTVGETTPAQLLQQSMLANSAASSGSSPQAANPAVTD